MHTQDKRGVSASICSKTLQDKFCSRLYYPCLLVVTQAQGFCAFPGSHGWSVQARVLNQSLLTPDLITVTLLSLLAHHLSPALVRGLQNHHRTNENLFI